jgi:hypothetical protein
MQHPHRAIDPAFLVQISAQLSKQRDELDRLRRAKVPGATPEAKIKRAVWRSHLGRGNFPSTTGSSSLSVLYRRGRLSVVGARSR